MSKPTVLDHKGHQLQEGDRVTDVKFGGQGLLIRKFPHGHRVGHPGPLLQVEFDDCRIYYETTACDAAYRCLELTRIHPKEEG